MDSEVGEILFDRDQLKARVCEIAREIDEEYQGKSVILVGILKGCMFFLADLIRELSLPISIDFISISAYGSSTERTGIVRILKDLETSVENQHVIIVEDIVDTGLTLGYLLKILKERSPASIRVCALLDKPSYRIIRVPVDYHGFELGRQFAVGYGLDYQEKYRHLPFICTLKKEVCPL